MKDIFCRIIEKEIPSKIIHEDDIAVVIMDVSPRSDGHLLVIPKEHYKDLYDIEETVINHIMNIAKEMSLLLSEKLHCDGVTLEQNNGISQEVKHFHLHIIPRYSIENNIRDLDVIYNKLVD